MNQAPRLRPHLRSAHPLRRGRTLAALTAVAVAAGLAAAPTASSAHGAGSVRSAVPAAAAPSDPCPQAYPVNSLERDQRVTGLTVSEGTDPDPFEGRVLGVLKDGIAPGLDMILVRLTSDEIDRVGGIWAGMSGSPVYATDGRLVGAVSYTLALGPSPVAGVTPAADMLALLTTARGTPAEAQVTPRKRVKVPRSAAADLTGSAEARQSLVDAGMRRMPLPVGISGMSSDKRLRKVTKKLDLDSVRYYRSSSAPTTAPGTPAPLVPGGNVAASLSYGDVSAVGVGTATAICDRKTIGFGHPMIFTGRSTLTLHGADALLIQEDPTLSPFKVANPGEPMGRIRQDRLAGILGVSGKLPRTTDVTSEVRLRKGGSRTGSTFISVPDAVPDIAPFHLLANEDRVFDGVAEGSSVVGWTVTGTREDGREWSYTRKDKFASKFDISIDPVIELADQLFQIHFNDVEEVAITSVEQTATMSRRFKAFRIATVEVRGRGGWQELATDRALRLRAGSTKEFRVTMSSSQLPSTRVRLALPVPANAAGRFGFLDILGGNAHFGGDVFGGEPGTAAETLDRLLARIEGAPRNDQVLAELFIFRNNGGVQQESVRRKVKAVVDGGVSVEVLVR